MLIYVELKPVLIASYVLIDLVFVDRFFIEVPDLQIVC